MSQSIGIAAVLSCDGSGLYRGLSQAATKMKAWAISASGSVGSLLGGDRGNKIGKSLAGGIIAGLGGVKTAIGKTLGTVAPAGKNVVGGLGGAAKIGAIGVAATAATTAVAGLYATMEKLDELKGINDAAKAFALSSEQASGLLGVLKMAGGATRENIEGLTQFSQKVQDAFTGKGEEAQKLFEGLSISAEDIINLPLDEKFYAVHKAIRELPQDAQMFKLSMLGGTDSMKTWLPLLAKSTDELRAQAKGLEISSAKMAEAEMSSKAMAAASGALDRALTAIAIAAAPVLEYFADLIPTALDFLSDSFGGWGENVMPVLHGLTIGVGTIWDTIRAGLGVVKIIAGSMTTAFGAVLESLKGVIDLAKELPDAVRPDWVDGLSNGVDKLAKHMQAAGNAAMDDGMGGIARFGETAKKADEFFEKWQRDREKRLKATIKRNEGFVVKAPKAPPLPIEDDKTKDKKEKEMDTTAKDAKRGGTLAREIEARFKFGNSFTDSKDPRLQLERDQLAVQREQLRKLAGIFDQGLKRDLQPAGDIII